MRSRLTRRRWLRFGAAGVVSRPLASLFGRPGKLFFGMNFSPFLDGQSPGTPISEEQIRSCLKILAPYTSWVRTYTSTGGLERAGAIAHQLRLKAAVGAWLGRDPVENERQLAAGIACARSGCADMLVVGSETLLRGELSTRQLAITCKERDDQFPKKSPSPLRTDSHRRSITGS